MLQFDECEHTARLSFSLINSKFYVVVYEMVEEFCVQFYSRATGVPLIVRHPIYARKWRNAVARCSAQVCQSFAAGAGRGLMKYSIHGNV